MELQEIQAEQAAVGELKFSQQVVKEIPLVRLQTLLAVQVLQMDYQAHTV